MKDYIEERVKTFAEYIINNKSTVRETGYFSRNVRKSLVEKNNIYNEIVIQAVYKEYEKEYHMPIKVILHSTLKYLSKEYTKKKELQYFENLLGIPLIVN